MSRRQRPTLKGPTAEQWNTKHPEGTRVLYRSHPDAEPILTKTRSHAWTLAHGEAVVLIEGKSGGVALWALEVVQATGTT